MDKLSEQVDKPWGAYHDMAEQPGKWHLKIIKVNKGASLSLQKHRNRSERWIIVEGEAKVLKGKTMQILKAGDTIFFDKEELHRIKAAQETVLIEVSFGVHDENDIVRLEDDYGRVG